MLPAYARTLAAALLVGCVALTVFLGVSVTHQTRAGALDAAITSPIRATLGQHPGVPALLVHLGDPIPVILVCGMLVAACLRTRRRRGALLVAIAVPAAAALTQLLLKPVVHRTLSGGLSFPSGHATAVFALAVAAAVLLVDPPGTRLSPKLRALVAFAGICTAGSIATALVGLDFHYPTDVVAGAAVGAGVVLLTALILDSN